MTEWYLNRALENFRTAVNDAYPHRDKGSDGTIGDEAHQGTSSDHNPDPEPQPDAGSVDAWDMDVEVNGKGQPYAEDVEMLKRIFEQHEASQYWIHNRKSASRSDDWREEDYDGDNPHDKHVHFNSRESHENSTAPWIIPGDDMEQVEKLIHDTGSPGRTVGNVFADVENLRNWMVSPPGTGGVGSPPAGSVGDVLLQNALNPPAAEVDMAVLVAQLTQELTPVMEAAAERAVRKVLGAVDE